MVTAADAMIPKLRGAAFGYPLGDRLGKQCRSKYGCGNRALWNSVTAVAGGEVRGLRRARAIVILSSAKDVSTGEGLEETVRMVRASGIPVYFVQLMPEHFDAHVNPGLARLARESGGEMFNAAVTSLDTILPKLSGLLRGIGPNR